MIPDEVIGCVPRRLLRELAELNQEEPGCAKLRGFTCHDPHRVVILDIDLAGTIHQLVVARTEHEGWQLVADNSESYGRPGEIAWAMLYLALESKPLPQWEDLTTRSENQLLVTG